MLKTIFWQKALASLPASVRNRHRKHIERAERWELAIDALVEAWSRAKLAFGRTFHTA